MPWNSDAPGVAGTWSGALRANWPAKQSSDPCSTTRRRTDDDRTDDRSPFASNWTIVR